MIKLMAALALGVALASPAHATPDGITVNSHGVVTSSTLPTCTVEDGSSGPRPCTWNIGPEFTPDDGLSYWVGDLGGFAYVWNGSPLAGHPERTWSPDRVRCWVGPLGNTGHCPNGDTFSV